MIFSEAFWNLQKDDEKPKEREKGKPRAIDNFLEELKLEQELREKRNEEREQWREGHHGDSSAVSIHTFSRSDWQKLCALRSQRMWKVAINVPTTTPKFWTYVRVEVIVLYLTLPCK